MKSERRREISGKLVGVNRVFPKKGETIEQRMERSLTRIRAEMPGEKVHLLVTKKDKIGFFDLPALGAVPGGKLAEWWVPRYNPVTGAVYTTRWDKPLAEIYSVTVTNSKGEEKQVEKKRVIDASSFAIIKQPEYRRSVDLAALPKSWVVAKLIPQEVWGGIESAMRQQDEIRGDYSVSAGVEYRRVEELFVAMRGLSQKYVRGQVTRKNLQDIAEETQALLEREAVVSAKGPFLQDLNEALVLVFKEDPLGRFNPLAARMRIYRAMRDLAKREVETWLSRRKANRVFNLLYVERVDDRSSLIDAQEEVVELGGFGKRRDGHPVFSYKNSKKIPSEEITEFRRILKGIGQALPSVRVAPYLIPARLADVMLRSNQFRKRWEIEQLREILEVGRVEGEMDKPSAEDLIMQRKPFETAVRLRQTHSLIREALEDPDNLVFTVFD